MLTLVASLLLLSLYAVPLWRVRLFAPQYPEGLGMLIHINTVAGAKPHDLQNINRLNHYIGMKEISPDAIPELRIMPWAVGALALFGVLVVAMNRRRALYVWLGGFAALALAGLADFWRWEYNYGHDLDFAHAIIKIPGMTYQPPLIGSKQLLNFTAISWPALGGWLVGVAFLLAAIGLVLTLRTSRPTPTRALEGAVMQIGARVRRLGRRVAWFALALVAGRLQAQVTRIVSPDGARPVIAAAVRGARPGDRLVIRAGVYREPTIIVDKRLEIVGDSGAVLDGEGARQIMTITADDVTVRGLTFEHVGTSFIEDRAAIKVVSANRCVIEENSIIDGFFGIYLANTSGCVVARNTLRANTAGAAREMASGNGIHLWRADNITIAENHITGHRDGIYFEFVHQSVVRGNVSEGNLRYGLHFMYSDDCEYVGNTFRRNGSGVAVMYTKRVVMVGNHFEDNRGAAAYGLLLKEITDSRLDRNTFARNTTGLFADGASRLQADRNDFLDNGWAIRLEASTQDARFTANNFVGNTFAVSTNSRTHTTVFQHNFWDENRSYDLDRDGFADVPFRPVRLFSLFVAQVSPSLILLRSPFVSLLDGAERIFPMLTPELLVDAAPAMRRVQ
jgi:nitrous oxidase accessory protein